MLTLFQVRLEFREMVGKARRVGILKDDKELFRGAIIISLGLPRHFLRKLSETLRSRQRYLVQFNDAERFLKQMV